MTGAGKDTTLLTAAGAISDTAAPRNFYHMQVTCAAHRLAEHDHRITIIHDGAQKCCHLEHDVHAT
jgi:hypothetical protein